VGNLAALVVAARMRRYFLDILVVVLATLAIFVAFAFRGYTPIRPPSPPVTRKAEPRFLLELEAPKQAVVRIGTQGELTGGKALTQSQWVDLREVVSRLKPDPSARGAWRVRFYDAEGAHEVRLDPATASAEQRELLQHLKALGLVR
jgi:hypothetical protein